MLHLQKSRLLPRKTSQVNVFIDKVMQSAWFCSGSCPYKTLRYVQNLSDCLHFFDFFFLSASDKYNYLPENTQCKHIAFRCADDMLIELLFFFCLDYSIQLTRWANKIIHLMKLLCRRYDITNHEIMRLILVSPSYRWCSFDAEYETTAILAVVANNDFAVLLLFHVITLE